MEQNQTPALPVVKGPQVPSLKLEDQLGLSCEQLAVTRVSAVENHLLKQQENILANISQLKDERKKLIDEREEISKKWVTDCEKKEAEKVAKALLKLPFGEAFEVMASSSWMNHIKSKENVIKVIVHIKQATECKLPTAGNGSVVATATEFSMPEASVKKREDLESKISSIGKQIDAESLRYEKAGKLLANMDKEERQARAALVAAKIRSMEHGDEMMDALLANLPEV